MLDFCLDLRDNVFLWVTFVVELGKAEFELFCLFKVLGDFIDQEADLFFLHLVYFLILFIFFFIHRNGPAQRCTFFWLHLTWEAVFAALDHDYSAGLLWCYLGYFWLGLGLGRLSR